MDNAAFERVMARLTSAFPRPTIPVPTLAVWSEHFDKLDFDTAWEAVLLLERTKVRLPALADFHEAYQEVRAAKPSRAVAAPICGICERGWVIDPHGRGVNEVLPCPSGCKPWTGEQHAAAARFDDYAFQRERAKDRTASEMDVDRHAGVRTPYRDDADEPF